MAQDKDLYKVKTVAEFERGYWYVIALKKFARDIGVVNSNKLRKKQLEQIIKEYIETGRVRSGNKPNASIKSKRDKLGLTENVQHYIGNKETKSFILTEALKLCPHLPKKSGVWYWTNRWREEQIEKKRNITYQELIQYFVKLSTQEGRLPQIPSARFNNFVTDFLAANEGSREEATVAWEQLKALNIPKTYAAWKSYHA